MEVHIHCIIFVRPQLFYGLDIVIFFFFFDKMDYPHFLRGQFTFSMILFIFKNMVQMVKSLLFYVQLKVNFEISK